MNVARLIRSSLLLLLLGPALSLVRADPETSVFGSRQVSESALIGILYDLKQSQEKEPIHMDTETYGEIVDEFLSKGWDESVLNRYFRAARPLYTTQIFIPLINADAAPRAFGVEKIVKPSFWLIHYKGQVVAPCDGTWRFWGPAKRSAAWRLTVAMCSSPTGGKSPLQTSPGNRRNRRE
ncbi:MAG: hypothetical protein ACOYM3_18400 [Terrimicrobiaceae bacterium]